MDINDFKLRLEFQRYAEERRIKEVVIEVLKDEGVIP